MKYYRYAIIIIIIMHANINFCNAETSYKCVKVFNLFWCHHYETFLNFLVPSLWKLFKVCDAIIVEPS